MSFLKRVAVRLLTTDPVVALTSRSAGWATVFMLHRFSCATSNYQGHAPEVLRSFLGWLRRHRYRIVDIETLRHLVVEGAPLARTVAFTLDDGYLEQGDFAAGLFAEFDAPSTTFLATGFLDGEMWCWWDRIEHILTTTHRGRLEVRVGNRIIPMDIGTPAQRLLDQMEFTEACKLVPDPERESAIARLAAAAEVDLPSAPPARYWPMSWEDARRAERRGMRFGAQTVLHPILSQVTAEESERELTRSWARVVEELKYPLPVFCYPNGMPGDFGAREVETLVRLGLRGAVVASPGYAEPGSGCDPYRLPRFAFQEPVEVNVMYAGGLQRIKNYVRGLGRPSG